MAKDQRGGAGAGKGTAAAPKAGWVCERCQPNDVVVIQPWVCAVRPCPVHGRVAHYPIAYAVRREHEPLVAM